MRKQYQTLLKIYHSRHIEIIIFLGEAEKGILQIEKSKTCTWICPEIGPFSNIYLWPLVKEYTVSKRYTYVENISIHIFIQLTMCSIIPLSTPINESAFLSNDVCPFHLFLHGCLICPVLVCCVRFACQTWSSNGLMALFNGQTCRAGVKLYFAVLPDLPVRHGPPAERPQV